MTVRTRIAPSPTGEFHIGGMRTLLYAFALAKKNNGKFILRIEDTDKARTVEGAFQRILTVIKDYGLYWDEGPQVGGPYAPYIQSERLELYKKHALELVSKGAAYYCFCTKERLDKIRAEQQAVGVAATKYDKHCESLSASEVATRLANKEDYVIRLKVPQNQVVEFNDVVLGKISISTDEIDDQVLLKSDGFPTYHLAVVVDDHMMQISHILRGMEWLPSTPKHVLLYKAFGWEMPLYVHLPLLKEAGKNKKMSKRDKSASAAELLKEGYLPEALLNFIMFLGWNPGGEKEIYSLEEFIKEFSLERLHQSDMVIFGREKLDWMNGHYIRNMALPELYDRITSWATKYDEKLSCLQADKEFSLKVLRLVYERLRTFKEYESQTHYFYKTPVVDVKILSKYGGDNTVKIFSGLTDLYTTITTWDVSTLDRLSHEFLQTINLSPKEVFMTLRVVITGETVTPPIFDILELLGKETVLKRLKIYSQ